MLNRLKLYAVVFAALLCVSACESAIEDVSNDTTLNRIYYQASEKIEIGAQIASELFNTAIVSHTFYEGEGVIEFSDELTSVGDYAFSDCCSIEWITIPNSVTTMGDGVFRGCSNLCRVVLPNGLTAIGDEMFYGCKKLADVVIPEGVTTIGVMAFGECVSLPRINIPASVTKVMPRAFSACDNLKRMDIASLDCWLRIDLSAQNGSVVMNFAIAPKSGCDLYIDGEPLVEVVIPDGKNYVDDCRFSYVTSVRSVMLHDKVRQVGYSAFLGCDNLNTLTIGSGVILIADKAFLTGGLTTIYCRAATPPTFDGDSCFEHPVVGRKIYVPRGSLEAYQRDLMWSLYYYDFEEYDFD